MKNTRKYMNGVTLIEILLVTVIISAFLMMISSYLQQKFLQMRFERTAANMKQVLSAASAYYIANAQWPPAAANLKCLQGKGLCPVVYLPTTIRDPFKNYNYSINSTATQFSVSIVIDPGKPKTYAYAQIIIGKLPSGYAIDQANPATPCSVSSDWCTVIAMVPVPPIKDTNNVKAVNFASVYHNGACVPVPGCVSDGTPNSMVASITVVPTSVTGAPIAPSSPNAPTATCNPTTQAGCSIEAYPISSYSAVATPPAKTNGLNAGPNSGPYTCKTASTGAPVASACYKDYDKNGNPIGPPMKGEYWRVCLSIVTSKGAVAPDENTWGQLTGTIMAITRCIKPGEDTGSKFNVWSQ